ncbi:hypothetical protein AV274_5819 [Blastocystis sp. ATCC 50177/Nand II]|uniref:Signal peptidase complex subunit 2 n=1 Tax=Blastocystis sp. subtype 1 (strain ATCC 50177 / NandII) TaxID=478820 RepID=A0A196S901_BLAHN|nr:hypothetical protein AV274_5819 [Blastocystis sp. ATCC 50177/Nand II]
MTIKHVEEMRITELGDNKVMKQAVDNAYFSALIENDVKPNYVYDIIIYSLRAINVCCAFANYFLYKDYYSTRDMVIMLSIIYYLFCGIDYLVNSIFVKGAFLIGNLPSGSKYSYAKGFRAESTCNFGDEDYTLHMTATVGEEKVEYVMKKPVASYFEEDGLLRQDVVAEDASAALEQFRSVLHKAASKKRD